MLMDQAALVALPASGSAWDAIITASDAAAGTPNLADINTLTHQKVAFAKALRYARVGGSTYRSDARDLILAAIGTEDNGSGADGALALSRQLAPYVMAADFINLRGLSVGDDNTFRTWLSTICTKVVGSHGLWFTVRGTHENAPANWGCLAGASRIATAIYLGDTTDINFARVVLQGFLGDRTAYSGFLALWQPEYDEERTWACSPDLYTPINPACTLSTINVDGVIPVDTPRDSVSTQVTLTWPPPPVGVNYTLEDLQGLIVQAELLNRRGYPVYTWSSQAIKRVGEMIERSRLAGGTGWIDFAVNDHIPWVLNKRYSMGLATRAAGWGRMFGFTDWLYQ
jgi:hypothetical protein